jgi:hypothetical protein
LVKKGFRAITFPLEQYRIVKAAIQLVRNREGDQKIPKGRAVELICADFLAGAYRVNGYESQPLDPWEGFDDSEKGFDGSGKGFDDS